MTKSKEIIVKNWTKSKEIGTKIDKIQGISILDHLQSARWQNVCQRARWFTLP